MLPKEVKKQSSFNANVESDNVLSESEEDSRSA